MRKLGFTLLGLILLPAVAGLAVCLFELLVDLQTEPRAGRVLFRFLAGAGAWGAVFLFVGRPLRLYILGHELSHLLAAWLSGARGGRLRVSGGEGSVEVERVTVWIALAPYMIPFYSLLLLAGFAVSTLWIDPSGLWPVLQTALGVTWSFHLTFTIFALSRPQSDLAPYGAFGALVLIVSVNLLGICAALLLLHGDPLHTGFPRLANHLVRAYGQATTWGIGIKNAIIGN